MRLLPSLSACDWIAEEPMGVMPTVMTSRLPPELPCWVKVLHDLHEDLSVPDWSQTWNEWERALPPGTDWGRAIEEAMGQPMDQRGSTGHHLHIVRLRWAELCRRFDVPFEPLLCQESFGDRHPRWGHSWPRRVVGPKEGYFDGPQRDALVSVLRRHTAAERILFHFWFLATADWCSDRLVEGALEDALRFPDLTLGARDTPSHWFPEDHAWLVCSDHDLYYTLVGGSAALAHDLLAHPVLECLPVRVGRAAGQEFTPD